MFVANGFADASGEAVPEGLAATRPCLSLYVGKNRAARHPEMTGVTNRSGRSETWTESCLPRARKAPSNWSSRGKLSPEKRPYYNNFLFFSPDSHLLREDWRRNKSKRQRILI